jgi:DNA-binding IclR family transcriptional regulator
MSRDDAQTILNTVAKNRAVALVELTTLVDLPDAEIEGIVKTLAEADLVKVSGSGLDRVVRIQEQGLRAAG